MVQSHEQALDQHHDDLWVCREVHFKLINYVLDPVKPLARVPYSM